MDIATEITNRLAGLQLRQVERWEYGWSFSFSDNLRIATETPWRILVGGRNRLGDCDHGQKFGLPEPVDGVRQAETLLSGKKVLKVTIRDDSGDLALHFDGDTTLEVINISSGYEGWNFRVEKLQVIALGGGELAISRWP